MADEDVKFTEAPAKRRAKAVEKNAEETPASVEELSPKEEIAARTAPDAKATGRFVKSFVISARDWNVDGPVDDMHRANQVATLQEALNRGLHPSGEAKFDGSETLWDGSVELTYSAPVVLAHLDEDPASTYTPRAAVNDMGGSTIQDAAETA